MLKKPNYIKLLAIAFSFIIIYVLLLSILIKIEAAHPQANIKSFDDALWFSIVTLTTVGYGDLHPVTDQGRLFGSIFLIFSLGFYGVLIGQITNIMNTVKENKKLGLDGTNFTNHVVMIGWSDFGKAVVDQLVAAGRNIAIVTKEKDNVDIIHEYYSTKQVFTLFSDYNNFDLLHKVNIRESSIVFVNLHDDTEKLVYVLNMKKHYENLNFVVTLDNANLKSTFHSAGVTYTVSKHEIASKLLASYIFEPDVAVYSEEIIAYPQTDEDYDIKQFMVLENNPFKDHLYEKVFFDLKKEFNVVLLGIVKIEEGQRRLYKNPSETIKIAQGDYLIMLTNKNAIKRLKGFFAVEEGYISNF